MTQEEFIAKLRKQIEDGENLFVRFESLTPMIQDTLHGFRLFESIKHYDKEEVSKLQSELYRWEQNVIVILSSYWGKEHPTRVRKFKESKTNEAFDFKSYGMDVIRQNLDVLISFVDAYSSVDDYDNTPDIGDETDVLQVNQQHNGDIGHTYNINAVNANVGAGTISTGDISGNALNQHVSSETKEELRHIIDEIAKEANDLNNQDILEYAQKAQQELEKPQGEKKTIQAWLYAINGVAAIISNAAIQELVSQGISLLF